MTENRAQEEFLTSLKKRGYKKKKILKPTKYRGVILEGYTKMRGVGGLLNLCQGGTCICDHQQNTVLYCYGEVGLYF